MNYFKEFEDVIFKYKSIGEETLDDGTVLIGRVPHIAPYAWLHSIYSVLTPEEIKLIENQTELEMPPSYQKFLTHYSNGIKIFSGALCLYGLRKKIGRSIESAYQPFSILTPNTIERIPDAKPYHFIVGGYKWDTGSLLYIDGNSLKIYRCSKKSIKPLNTWDTFNEMLFAEVNRLSLLFDEKGVKKIEKEPTIPSPDKR